MQWPLYKGFAFTCWLRVENFPRSGTMGLFSFLTENGRGCLAVVAKDKLIYEVSISLFMEYIVMFVYLNIGTLLSIFASFLASMSPSFEKPEQDELLDN